MRAGIAIWMFLTVAWPVPTQAEDSTEGADVLSAGAVSVEGGWLFAADSETREHSVGQMLGRAGLGRGFEVRAALSSYQWSRSTEEAVEGLTDASVGFKMSLFSRDGSPAGIRPATALLISATIPSGASGLRSRHVQSEVRGCFGWTITPTIGVNSNMALIRSCDDGSIRTGWGASASVTRSWRSFPATYLEYATVDLLENPQHRREHRVVGGLLVPLPTGVQIEVRAGTTPGAGDRSWFGGWIVQRQWP